MKKPLIFYAISAALLLITSCAKEEGPQGPAGPQGIQGPTGPPGATGNANVIVKTFTLYPSDFTEYGTSGQTQHRYSATRSVSEITSDVYYNGMVVLYYQGGGTTPPPWYSLPQTLYESSYSYTLTYSHQIGGVSIQRYDSDLHSIPPSFNLTVKAVIVPPATGKREWDVNWSDYNAVKEYFHLQD